MPYFSEFYQVEVRDEIAKEFTNSLGQVDDMMAGLHEIRVRRAEKEYDLLMRSLVMPHITTLYVMPAGCKRASSAVLDSPVKRLCRNCCRKSE
ncbi:MAG: hypothetical protein Q8P40_02865 [Nitrospirota bacterium]|nr:hypothetical protein [Nitrospirota bacterium]